MTESIDVGTLEDSHYYVTICYSQLCSVLFCSLAILDPMVGHTMDVLFPFISVLCHSD